MNEKETASEALFNREDEPMSDTDTKFSKENAHCFACEHSDACMQWQNKRMLISCAAKKGAEQVELMGESCDKFKEADLPED